MTMVTVWWSAADVIHYNFLQPGQTIIARPYVLQITIRKLNELSVEVLPHPPYSPDISPTDYHLFKHFDNFLIGRTFTNQDWAEMAFVDLIESRAPNFYADGINRLCYFGKSALIRMALSSIKLNKFLLRYYSLKYS